MQLNDLPGLGDTVDQLGHFDATLDGPAAELVPDLVAFETWPPLDVVDDGFVPGCQPGDGCFLDPCNENGDCLSGWCVEHLGDGVCTQNCQEECPPGWGCQQVGTGPDVAFVCISKVANLCRPCATGADCKSPGGAEDVCVVYGESLGSFCGGACLDDEDCPWGFACALSQTISGTESKQCVAASGTCPCSSKSVTLGLATPCTLSNDMGSCSGERLCTELGLTDCDAPVPVFESCDGLDNDCNSLTDEGTCDDSNECTKDSCLGDLGCEHLPLDGGECKDNNPCTVADTCVAGSCTGQEVDCDDFDPCTDDFCQEVGGCGHSFNNAPCDDGDVCTVADQCAQGECAGVKVGCECESTADCGALEDGNFCNGTLVCDTDVVPHKCVVDVASIIVCPEAEGNDAICLQAQCDAASGACSLVPAHSGFACEDGDPCTSNDTCVAGACTGGPDINCNDGNPCTDDACTTGVGCTYLANDLPCEDGNLCSVNDSCANAACVPGPAMDCNDGNPCTDDVCTPGIGCQHTSNTAPCDDGNACTTKDQCLASVCVGKTPPDCDDANPCTLDSCAPDSGCVASPLTGPACSDGSACTLSDSCQAGQCVGGAPMDCNDGNPCTDDSCDAAKGCLHLPNQAPCNDNNACTTEDVCSNGQCQGNGSLDCDDSNPCTLDICLPAGGCDHQDLTGAACSDGNGCTLNDQCDAGLCVGGQAMDCNDNNPCTADSCNPETELCTHAPQDGACDDGNACTLNDQCGNGTCLPGVAANCDDDNLCTTDSCTPETGCVHLVNSAPCNDNDLCTTNDTCQLGQCVGGPALACNDNNGCTADSCAADIGCLFTPTTAPCDDGSECTTEDTCTNGLCLGKALSCDDDNFCTSDLCDPDQGCLHLFNGNPCDDGEVCTINDVCTNGLCQGSGPLVCNDGNPCTDDTCQAGLGCAFVANTAPCDDQSACTTDDTCSDGVCVGGPAPDCDDANICTDDGCDPDIGCLHLANNDPCDDGSECTTSDTCADKACVGGAAPNCDDANVCTQDSCAPDTGCVHDLIKPCCGNNIVEAPEECDDGNQGNGDGCDANCQDEGLGFPPPVGHTETSYGGPWKICRADASTAWLTSNSSGTYHAVNICKYLGYTGVNANGGTCGTVCGYCGSNSEQYDGSNGCTLPMVCNTVAWRCYK